MGVANNHHTFAVSSLHGAENWILDEVARKLSGGN